MHQIEKIEAQSSFEWQVYEAALWYASQGIYILPLAKNSKMLPGKESGINYGSASKNSKTMKKWFDPHNGIYRGHNIGIACGKFDGVFAIDLDTHKGKDGLTEWKRLAAGKDKIDCPVQKTPSGGVHMLLRWREGCRSTTSVAKTDGIDTRGGTEAICKGHIVAFPSKVQGKQYMWEKWTDIPPTPDWVIDLLGGSEEWAKKPQGRGSELVGEDDVEEILDVDQIERMLEYINPDDCDYDKWLRVGLAIKSQYPGPEGLDIWDAWSQTGERYKNGECEIRWNGFSDFGTVRAGTLFHYAEEGGWQQEPGERRGNKFDALVSKMNEEYAIVTVGGKIRVLREKENPYEMDMHYDLMDKDSFKTLLENQYVEVAVNGKTKKVPITAIWLGHEGRRTYRNGIGLFPDNRVPDGYFNTWNGFTVSPKPGNCQKFLDHIKHVVCDDDDNLGEWVLDWVADLFQDPANPKGCAIVMRGDEGAGKGIFANTIGSMLGPHHRHLIDDTHLTSNFNAHLLDAVTVFADEITWGGNKKTAGKLKGMVTETHLVGERKGIDAILYRNMIHLFIASNSDWVIPAGTNSRRWCVLNVSNERCRDRKYFNDLIKEIENGGREAILHYFMTRHVTSDLRRAPETKGLLDQRMLNKQDDNVFQWWRKVLIAGKIQVVDCKDDTKPWPEHVIKIDLYEAYEEHVLARRDRPVAENVFAKKLGEYGISQSRIRVGNGRQRVYVLPNLKNATDILNTIIPGAISDENDNDRSKGRRKRR